MFEQWFNDSLASMFQSFNPLNMIDASSDALIGLWTPVLSDASFGTFTLLSEFTLALGIVIGVWYLIPTVILAMSTGNVTGIARAVVGLGLTAASGPTVLWTANLLRQPVVDTAQGLWAWISVGSILDSLESNIGGAVVQTLITAFMMMIAGLVYVLAGFIASYSYLFVVLLAPIAFAGLIMKGGAQTFIKWLVAFLSLMFAPIWAVIGLGAASIMAQSSPPGLVPIAIPIGLILAAFAPFTAIVLINKYVPHGGGSSDSAKVGAGSGASGSAQSAYTARKLGK